MVYYTFQDLPGDQYYSLKLIVNAELESLGSYNVGDMFYYEYNYRTSSSGIDGSSSVDLYSYLRFSDGLFNEELKTYKFGVMYDPYNLQYYLENNYQFKLQFYSLNENFYTYLQTLEAYYNAEGDFFAESINLFSNVEGGLGIFAGAVLSEVDVDLSGIVTTKSENK
ncbi:MAG: hypothetical protein C0599_01260 [Salinivirgaceae bacterium]|nr:MAG: hypothetical protein C0599_01260 [Salinivirgaceae bacterium]